MFLLKISFGAQKTVFLDIFAVQKIVTAYLYLVFFNQLEKERFLDKISPYGRSFLKAQKKTNPVILTFCF